MGVTRPRTRSVEDSVVDRPVSHNVDSVSMEPRTCGDALSRRFRVEGVIGVGGMAIVVSAHHLALDIRVAIRPRPG